MLDLGSVSWFRAQCLPYQAEKLKDHMSGIGRRQFIVLLLGNATIG